MDVFEAIKKRRSIRGYQEKDISKEALEQILEAARQAPSASNRQEWRFIVVKEQSAKAELARAAKNQKFLEKASVIIACCAQTDHHVMTCGQACHPIDIAIAIDHMTLAAVELGLGTCWIGAFHSDQVRKILNIPQDIPVIELLALGIPEKTTPSPKNRLPLKDIIFWEKWGQKQT